MSQRVIIIGAGMIGLALAKQLAQANIAVDIVEAKVPVACARVSALNPSTQQYLESLGVWHQLPIESYCPFDKIEAWLHDHDGKVEFDALSAGCLVLGAIVKNSAVVDVLWKMAAAHDNITLHCPDAPKSYEYVEDHVILHCQSGNTLSADLIVGADGAKSWLRQQMGVECEERSYGQQAIVATLKTEKTHYDTAYQSFLKTGPLGVLPLRDPHQVSIVWSADDARAEQLMAMNQRLFNCAVANAMNVRLGQMHLQGDRHCFPLIMRHAKQYVKPHLALLGDAAHTIHPLAGQGANLGFKDAQALAKVIITGDSLKRYQAQRRADNQCMALAMLAFREVLTNDTVSVVVAKMFNVVDRLPFVKKVLLQN